MYYREEAINKLILGFSANIGLLYDSNGEDCIDPYNDYEFTGELNSLIKKDCESFFDKIEHILPLLNQMDIDFNLMGGLFLMSRNQEGTGFFDHKDKYGDYADTLQGIAESFGGLNFFLNDNDEIYCEVA